MRPRTAGWLGWSLLGLSAVLSVSALVLNLSRPEYANLAATTSESAISAALTLFGYFGALIVCRRPTHPIGWILCALGLGSAL